MCVHTYSSSSKEESPESFREKAHLERGLRVRAGKGKGVVGGEEEEPGAWECRWVMCSMDVGTWGRQEEPGEGTSQDRTVAVTGM